MIVAGGVYIESCVSPSSTLLYGSAGRAAMGLVGLSSEVTLHTFSPGDLADDVVASFVPHGIKVHISPSTAAIEFTYLHPLSRPRIAPIPLPKADAVMVQGDVVLRFGALEGQFQVQAGTAVYDPQSGSSPEPFGANGSHAERLALVLNLGELASLTGEADRAQGAARLLAEGAEIVVVKAGADGAHVFEGDRAPVRVPAYQAQSIYKIGSGDIFSATFAHYWGEVGLPAVEAATEASLQTAHYVETRALPCPSPAPRREPIVNAGRTPRIYLGGPFFTAPQRWMIQEAFAGLQDLGADVFSPLHDIGFGPPSVVAVADLAGLDGCDAMLALLPDMDPGTLFETGHARLKGIPVIAYFEGVRPQDPTMLLGTGCIVESDFATALYRVVWEGGR